jgi:two-component system sensor histidine kinase YesM
MLTEIRELIARLNSTIEELHEEKDKVKEEQYLKRKAELSALQAQINPHFLYNTLNSIVWMADNVEAKEISYMAAALGTFFRVSLSKGQEFIPLRDEIQHVQSYLYIQKIRYVDKIQYELSVNEQLLDKMTLKLLLQPFVENAIRHGINEMDGVGIIRVTADFSENGEDIELHVIDNGLGINPQALAAINRRLKAGFSGDKEGYGIYNVNERIRLCFGSEYGIRVVSEPGKGTDVAIRIPDIKMEDVDRYV